MKNDEVKARAAAGLNPHASGKLLDHHIMKDGSLRRGKPLVFNPNAIKYVSYKDKLELKIP
jgi:hypothetical protein